MALPISEKRRDWSNSSEGHLSSGLFLLGAVLVAGGLFGAEFDVLGKDTAKWMELAGGVALVTTAVDIMSVGGGAKKVRGVLELLT